MFKVAREVAAMMQNLEDTPAFLDLQLEVIWNTPRHLKWYCCL